MNYLIAVFRTVAYKILTMHNNFIKRGLVSEVVINYLSVSDAHNLYSHGKRIGVQFEGNPSIFEVTKNTFFDSIVKDNVRCRMFVLPR